jgi:hypothetical protein
MPISKNFMTGNGLSTFHRVAKASLKPEGLGLEVRSYPDESKGTDAFLLWQEYPKLPVTALDVNDPYGSLERALTVTEGNPFFGGTYLPEKVEGDLESLKARKWAEIKAARDTQESAGFTVEGIGTFDSDSESRSRITGTAIAAKIAKDAGQPFSVEWTLADNTAVVLDADQVITVGFAMLTHITSTHEKGRVLRAQIDAAQTAEEVEAITW